jgi:hypothetical protein
MTYIDGFVATVRRRRKRLVAVSLSTTELSTDLKASIVIKNWPEDRVVG